LRCEICVNDSRQRGSTLAVGLMLLSLVTLLALAGSSGAQVEQLLAQNESFRENAASAASAGIEMAIRAIVTSPDPESVVPRITAAWPDPGDSVEVTIQFKGYEFALPQAAGAPLAGAHFDIVSTGRSARGAVDRQRAGVRWVVPSPEPGTGTDCEPLSPRRCVQLHELRRYSWQRVPAQ
jgi:type II secretory pathway component PulK